MQIIKVMHKKVRFQILIKIKNFKSTIDFGLEANKLNVFLKETPPKEKRGLERWADTSIRGFAAQK